jgi:hypothetical protein
LYRLNKISYNVIKERRIALKKEESSNNSEAKSGKDRVDLLSLYLNKENFKGMSGGGQGESGEHTSQHKTSHLTL